MCVFEISVQCGEKFFEVLPEEVESAELAVEDVMSHVLLKLFGGGTVDNVTMHSSTHSPGGSPTYSLSIRVECPRQGFTLLPRTEEHMRHAMGIYVGAFLKELFLLMYVENVTLNPSPMSYV